MNENTMGGIYLEPEKIIKNAEEIAEKSKNDEKFVFRIKYESAARAVVLAEISRLDCEIINQSDSDSTVTVRISMPQLAAIKTLNCIEKVDIAEEIETENTVNKKVLHNVEKYDTISIKTENEPILSANVQMAANSAIAPLCYGGGSDGNGSNTMQTAHYLPLASWKEGCICCPCAEQWYRFTASISEADTYTIYTSGSLDTVGYLYDANGTLLASNDDSNGNRNFKITRQLTTGSRYYVKVKGFANNTGNYDLRVDYTVRSSSCGGTSCDDNKASASELVVNRWQSGEICCPCAVKWYKFTPQNSAYYTIYTAGSLDTVGAIYDANDNLIKSNDDGGQRLNFKLVSYLTAGQTYYVKVNAYSNLTGRYSIAAISAVFVESVSITDPYITLNKGETSVLTTEVLPSYATNKSLWWQSGDNNIVTVSSEGVITAVDGGTTSVVATTRDSSGRSGCCTVTVNVPVESVKVNDERRIMYTGTTDRFEATVCPYNATNKLIRWSSTNTNVATVDPATGRVAAISAGTARIIATAQDGTGKSGACELTVKPAIPVEGVTICSSTCTMKVGETTRLSYSVYPVDATNQRVTWCSSDPNVVSIDYRTGKMQANDVGTAVISVTTLDGSITATCIVTVCSIDPFHHSNIEYVRIKKWRSVKSSNSIEFVECDMTTVATKSYINDLTYFTVIFPDEGEITTFEINNALISKLLAIESEYQSQFYKTGRPLCFHNGKKYVDGFVSEGKIEYASPEYYGIWAYNGNSICELNDRVSLTFAMTTAAYSGFMYGFTTIMSLQTKQMLTGQTKTYNNSRYNDLVESQKAIADISDDAAVNCGKTDLTSVSEERRSWRGSEMRAAEDYSISDGYVYNKSYKIIDGKLVQVPHGTAGSQRPDFYHPQANSIIEVKNYNVTTQIGRNNLANNISNQYYKRKSMFVDADIIFLVDVYGQSYTGEMLNNIKQMVESLTGNGNMIKFIFN